MADLYPTPTRLDLLDDIADGNVTTDPGGSGDIWLTYTSDGRRRRYKVTAKVTEMACAGWCQAGQPWRLTEAGEAIRAAHGRTVP